MKIQSSTGQIGVYILFQYFMNEKGNTEQAGAEVTVEIKM